LVSKLAVLGGGAGGQSIAADMTLAGFDVSLFELPQFKDTLKPIQEKGGVEIEGISGANSGFARLKKITTNIKEAIAGADLIIVSVPSYGHRPFSEHLAPHVSDGQMVAFVGEGCGSLEFTKVLRDKGIKKNIIVGETNTLPYGARVRGPAKVRSERKKGGTLVAAMPAKNNQIIYDALRQLWSYVTPAEHVGETILVNFNAIDHVPNFILNLGRVEGTTGEMKFWGEGTTPGVARVIEAVDNETIAMRRALGCKDLTPYKDYLYKQGFLDSIRPTTYEAIHGGRMAESIFTCGPQATQHRYITEDVPYSHVLMASIGDVVNVDTPAIDSLITLASIFNQQDYWRTGRTLSSLGVPTKSAQSLKRYLLEGVS